MENLIDLLGEMAMAAAIVTPFIVMPLVWKYLDGSRSTRVKRLLHIAGAADHGRVYC